jgi:hypothetical protein
MRIAFPASAAGVGAGVAVAAAVGVGVAAAVGVASGVTAGEAAISVGVAAGVAVPVGVGVTEGDGVAAVAVGVPGVVVVDPSPALFLRAARGEKDDPALAALVVTSEDSQALRGLLRTALAEAGPGVREPDHPGRERLRGLLGGAWVDLFRRAR